MSTENNPYLTVPDYGQLNQNFGKEKLYSGYTAPSAVSDLAAAAAASNLQTGARTPDKGKYVYDSKTGQYIWVPATAAAAVNTGIAASPAYINQDRGGGGGRGDMGPTGDGYSAPSSPLSSPMSGGFAYGLVDAISGIPGPLGFLAGHLGQAMNPQAVANAGKASAQAQQDALQGYTSGTMFGAGNTGAASTFGGAGYGTPTSQGGYGVTGQTGAGTASRGGMGVDPAQAGGQGAYSGGTGAVSSVGAGQAANPMSSDPAQSGAAAAAATDAANAAAAAANPASEGMGAPNAGPQAGDAQGSGGGGGGGRVICTHFYRKGEMDRDMWRADLEFTFKRLSPITVRGYQYWAIPYVKLMRKSKLAEDIIRPLAFARARELTYQMGRSPKGSVFGKVVRLVCEPICFAVGLFVGEQNWQALWTPVKD